MLRTISLYILGFCFAPKTSSKLCSKEEGTHVRIGVLELQLPTLGTCCQKAKGQCIVLQTFGAAASVCEVVK